MIHCQLGIRRTVNWAKTFACASILATVMAWLSGQASAGEIDRGALLRAGGDPAQCGSRGQGLGALEDSGDCRRINGYVAAGARFGSADRIDGLPNPFAPLDDPGIAGGRASGVMIVGAPPGRDG
ncbi:MAG: hypothetical protein ACREDI_07455, partial [Roseiarcus sp.]